MSTIKQFSVYTCYFVVIHSIPEDRRHSWRTPLHKKYVYIIKITLRSPRLLHVSEIMSWACIRRPSPTIEKTYMPLFTPKALETELQIQEAYPQSAFNKITKVLARFQTENDFRHFVRHSKKTFVEGNWIILVSRSCFPEDMNFCLLCVLSPLKRTLVISSEWLTS